MAMDEKFIPVLVLLLLGCSLCTDNVQEFERPVCPPGANCYSLNHSSSTEFEYTVNGKKHFIQFSEGNYYEANCKAAELTDSSLPRFPRPFSFDKVFLRDCAPPDSLAGALRALNITVRRNLRLVDIPPGARLSAATLSGLPSTLVRLELSAAGNFPLVPEPGALAYLTQLKDLKLNLVQPDRLPPNLLRLELIDSGFEHVSAEDLKTVEELSVTEGDNITKASVLPAASKLRVLTLIAPMRALPPLPTSIKNVSLSNWEESEPPAWRGTKELLEISISTSKIERLPAGWVEECGQLKSLRLRYLRELHQLPAELLRGASQLLELEITNTMLGALPPDLFFYSPDLKVINLKENQLKLLPSEIFSTVTTSLLRLDLSKNNLSKQSISVVATLTRLHHLNLAGNRLGDLCSSGTSIFLVQGSSMLSKLCDLKTLSLSNTGATHLCVDWLQDMQHLRRLDLTHNNITAIQMADLKRIRRNQPSELDLTYNDLRAVLATESDYLASGTRGTPPTYKATVAVNSKFVCDCRVYWAAKMLIEGRVPAALDPLCRGPRAPAPTLLAVPPDHLERLVCPLLEPYCPPECTCMEVPALKGVVASCPAPPRAALPALLARLAATDDPALQLVRLRVRCPGPTLELPPLPSTINYVDLSNGNLSRGDATFVRRVFADGRSVDLRRNPLHCACDGDPFLDALRDHAAQIVQLANTTCADGEPLDVALADPRCSTRPLVGGAHAALLAAALAALALAALALAALLASPERRLRIKALLHSRGVRLRWLTRRVLEDGPGGDGEEEAGGRRWDAFVVYAAADAALVALELVPRLRAYRLCLAYRDWPVGGWIPDLIQASVNESKRTVAVVTPAFLECEWSMASVRAAHAACVRERRPRLLLVLAQGLTRAALPPALRAAAATDTTLALTDRYFWEKLLYALPDPRPSTPPPPAKVVKEADRKTGVTPALGKRVEATSPKIGAARAPTLDPAPAKRVEKAHRKAETDPAPSPEATPVKRVETTDQKIGTAPTPTLDAMPAKRVEEADRKIGAAPAPTLDPAPAERPEAAHQKTGTDPAPSPEAAPAKRVETTDRRTEAPEDPRERIHAQI